MMSLFRLDASIRTNGSHSREIADIVEEEWLAGHPDDTVIRRHVGTDLLPADAWARAVGGDTDALRLAATLADELLAADALLFAVPLYNYGVSQHFKTYVDLLLTDPRALGGPTRLLEGKPLVLATVRGGAYGAGTPREGWDHSTPYLRRILGDVLGADVTVVEREFTLVGVNPALDAHTEEAAAMHSVALDAAREAGKALAA
jgi:FMN-dependent NADH-azoreductase